MEDFPRLEAPEHREACFKEMLRYHGMNDNFTLETLPGEVQHLISPLVGKLSLTVNQDKILTPREIEHMLERLKLLLDVARDIEKYHPQPPLQNAGDLQ